MIFTRGKEFVVILVEIETVKIGCKMNHPHEPVLKAVVRSYHLLNEISEKKGVVVVDDDEDDSDYDDGDDDDGD